MSDEQLAEPTRKIGFVRYLCGVVGGVISGFLLSMAIVKGTEHTYIEELLFTDTWGVLFWGEHYIIRMIWSLTATAGGALVAGLIARRRGLIIGLVTGVPTILVWLYAVVLWVFEIAADSGLDYSLMSLGNKVVSILIPLLTVPISAVFGRMGETLAGEHSHHFDARKCSFLGVKWYHHLWIWIVLYFYVIQTAWIINYGFDWYRMSSGVFFVWDNILPSICLMVIIMTLGLTFDGVAKAYDRLTDYQRDYGKRETIKGVLLYGFGFPMLAMIAQQLIVLIYFGINYLLS